MIIYKCNGVRFSDDKKCTSTHEAISKDDKPLSWITIDGHIHNNGFNARLITGNGLMHFCSQECLEYYLFKEPSVLKLGKTRKLLSESYKTLKWMFENMQVVNPDLQSDAFNIPANTLSELEEYFDIKKPLVSEDE